MPDGCRVSELTIGPFSDRLCDQLCGVGLRQCLSDHDGNCIPAAQAQTPASCPSNDPVRDIHADFVSVRLPVGSFCRKINRSPNRGVNPIMTLLSVWNRQSLGGPVVLSVVSFSKEEQVRLVLGFGRQDEEPPR